MSTAEHFETKHFQTRHLFAFGLDMNIENMRRRCPDAQFRGIANLPGKRICLTGNHPYSGGAVLSYADDLYSSVPGVLYEVHEAMLRKLDMCEGVPLRARRLTETVVLQQGYWVKAVVYVPHLTEWVAPMGRHYRQAIELEYQRFGFNREDLVGALVEAEYVRAS